MDRLSKQELKSVKRYKNKKYRQRDHLFLAEGNKLVFEILQSKIKPKFIIISKEWQKNNSQTIPFENVKVTENHLFKKLSSHKNPEGILAVCNIPQDNSPDLPKQSLVIALEFLQDPGNLGTIIRIADWFGIETIVCSSNTTDAYNPKVVQATMGSIARVNVHYTDLKKFLQNTNLPVYGATLSGESMYQLNQINNGILLIGNESNGISPDLMPFVSHEITIPKSGQAESLNAGVATGILVAQLLKPHG